MSVVVAATLAVWLVSGVGLVVTVLLHSGKGTGISDAISGSVYSAQTGTRVIEKNLDRITVGCAVVFFASLLVLMVVYPTGSVAG